MNHDPDKLPIGGHAYGNLTPEEEKALYRAALDDQAIFDELMDEEAMRQLLQKPAARRELLSALREADQTVWDKLFAFLQKPAGLAMAGGLAALAFIIGLVGFGGGTVDKPDVPGPTLATVQPPTPDDAALGAQLFGLPIAKDLTGPALTLSQPKYRIGDPFRLTLAAAPGTRVYVVEQLPDGTFLRRFPTSLQAETLVDPSGQIQVPASGQGADNVAGPTGTRKIRLAVFPADLSPAQLNAENAGRVTIVEKTYEVEQ